MSLANVYSLVSARPAITHAIGVEEADHGLAIMDGFHLLAVKGVTVEALRALLPQLPSNARFSQHEDMGIVQFPRGHFLAIDAYKTDVWDMVQKLAARLPCVAVNIAFDVPIREQLVTTPQLEGALTTHAFRMTPHANDARVFDTWDALAAAPSQTEFPYFLNLNGLCRDKTYTIRCSGNVALRLSPRVQDVLEACGFAYWPLYLTKERSDVTYECI